MEQELGQAWHKCPPGLDMASPKPPFPLITLDKPSLPAQALPPCKLPALALASPVLNVSLLEPCVLRPLSLLSSITLSWDFHPSSICMVLVTAGELGSWAWAWACCIPA